ncbi:MAG: endonuclease V [Planctomycetes bacterium]|nr:endonuclease V [Planctomycetota bacterium]
MRIRNLHRWNLSIPAAKALQSRLAPRVSAKTPRGFAPRFVAGADMSHQRGSQWLYGAVVVLDLKDFSVIETACARRRMTFPYVPGYLSFREAPVLLDCFRKIRSRIDAAFFDGQGYAHPRRFGLACHVGLWLGVPSVGCAKSRFIGAHGEVGEKPGARAALKDGRERIGTVLRTRAGSKPLYVSVGNAIALKDAEALVLRCCDGKHRLPEPARRAHEAVNAYRRSKENF